MRSIIVYVQCLIRADGVVGNSTYDCRLFAEDQSHTAARHLA